MAGADLRAGLLRHRSSRAPCLALAPAPERPLTYAETFQKAPPAHLSVIQSAEGSGAACVQALAVRTALEQQQLAPAEGPALVAVFLDRGALYVVCALAVVLAGCVFRGGSLPLLHMCASRGVHQLSAPASAGLQCCRWTCARRLSSC